MSPDTLSLYIYIPGHNSHPTSPRRTEDKALTALASLLCFLYVICHKKRDSPVRCHYLLLSLSRGTEGRKSGSALLGWQQGSYPALAPFLG